MVEDGKENGEDGFGGGEEGVIGKGRWGGEMVRGDGEGRWGGRVEGEMVDEGIKKTAPRITSQGRWELFRSGLNPPSL